MDDLSNTIFPLGMRMNNPGNLRGRMGDVAASIDGSGFAKFESLEAGVFALVKLCDRYWNVHGWRSLDDFVSHYAPASENDVLRYKVIVAQFAKLNPLRKPSPDLQLDRAIRALDFMRAIVHVEQGGVPSSWRAWPEWVPLGMWASSMNAIPMWKGQL